MPHKKSPPGYLSVTEAIGVIEKPFLQMWRGKLGNAACNKIQKESRLLGETVHNEIVRQFNGLGFDTKRQDVTDMVARFFKKFVVPYKVVPLSMEPEEPLVDHVLKLQGTYDAVITTPKYPGELIIADWKTSNQLDLVGVPLQLAAYAHLYPQPIKHGVAVRIDKKTDALDILWYDDVTAFWPHFVHALELARYVKNVRRGKDE